MFSVDVALNYSRFHMDFGPVNISQVIKFKSIIEKKLSVNYLKVSVLNF